MTEICKRYLICVCFAFYKMNVSFSPNELSTCTFHTYLAIGQNMTNFVVVRGSLIPCMVSHGTCTDSTRTQSLKLLTRLLSVDRTRDVFGVLSTLLTVRDPWGSCQSEDNPIHRQKCSLTLIQTMFTILKCYPRFVSKCNCSVITS